MVGLSFPYLEKCSFLYSRNGQIHKVLFMERFLHSGNLVIPRELSVRPGVINCSLAYVIFALE